LMPILRAVLITRQAISPRLAMSIFWNMAASYTESDYCLVGAVVTAGRAGFNPAFAVQHAAAARRSDLNP
jgi:hypothetical protein